MSVLVVKGKEEFEVVHQVDLDGWLKAGWKVKELPKEKTPSKE